MKEIITVQVGTFANFVGSHFWNFQDELLGLAEDVHGDSIFKNTGLDMDILYRLGETSQGRETYTPRLLAIDARGSLGAICASGSLYNEMTSTSSSVSTWDGAIAQHATEPREKNDFLCSLEEEDLRKTSSSSLDYGEEESQQDDAIRECLENGVQFWTDYSKVQFHPLSLYELEGVWKDVTPFDDYGSGRGIVREASQREELSSRLHFFVEECDHLQGFQFLVDDSGGFATVTTEFLDVLTEEYDRAPILLYTVRDPITYVKYQNASIITRRLHDAISFSKLSSSVGLMVPVGLPSLSRSETSRFLSIDDSKLFHSSAIYATSFHTSSLPLRMEASRPSANIDSSLGGMDMDTMIWHLSHQSRNRIPAILDVSIPAPPIKDSQYNRLLQRNLHPLTPDVSKESLDSHISECLVVQGVTHENKGQRAQASISEINDCVCKKQQGAKAGLSVCHLSVSTCPLPIPLPFPRIFGSSVGKHGEILGRLSSSSNPPGSHDVLSIPMATRLRCSRAVLPYVKKKMQDLTSLGIMRGSPGSQIVEEWGFEKVDVQELAESLVDMVHCLDTEEPGSYSDSD